MRNGDCRSVQSFCRFEVSYRSQCAVMIVCVCVYLLVKEVQAQAYRHSRHSQSESLTDARRQSQTLQALIGSHSCSQMLISCFFTASVSPYVSMWQARKHICVWVIVRHLISIALTIQNKLSKFSIRSFGSVYRQYSKNSLRWQLDYLSFLFLF